MGDVGEDQRTAEAHEWPGEPAMEPERGPPRHHQPREHDGGHDAGQLSPDERPDARSPDGGSDRDASLDDRPAEVRNELAAEVEVALQQHNVDGAERLERKRESEDAQQGSDERLVEERRHQRSGQEGGRREEDPEHEVGDVDGVGCLVGVLAALDEGPAEAEILEHGEIGDRQRGESHDPELLGREQPGEDCHRDEDQHLAGGERQVVPQDGARRAAAEGAGVGAGGGGRGALFDHEGASCSSRLAATFGNAKATPTSSHANRAKAMWRNTDVSRYAMSPTPMA